MTDTIDLAAEWAALEALLLNPANSLHVERQVQRLRALTTVEVAKAP